MKPLLRFGKIHLTEDGRNIRNNSEPPNDSSNFLSKDLQYKLRKRLYNFSKSENILNKLNQRTENIKLKNSESYTETLTKNESFCDTEFKPAEPLVIIDHETTSRKNNTARIGPIDDSDTIKYRPEEKKTVCFSLLSLIQSYVFKQFKYA